MASPRLWSTDLERDRVQRRLVRTGALIRGHFIIPPDAGHYHEYIQIPLAMQHSADARFLAVTLGRAMRRSGLLAAIQPGKPLTVLAPEDAGIPVAFWLGEAVQADRVLWARQRNGQWQLRRFLQLTPDDQVLLVDDVLFSGKTLKTLAEMVRKAGARLLGVATIVDRRLRVEELEPGLPTVSLMHQPAQPYEQKACPYCEKDEPLVTIER